MIEDKLITEDTIEEITVEETNGASVGTMIVTNHTLDGPNKHTIRQITGLEGRLSDLEVLKNTIRAKNAGHADYYQCGEENIEAGYFVRLDENGFLWKCTNGATSISEDLELEKNDKGEVIIYELAGSIRTDDMNKHYVVGITSPYNIFAYDGLQYVQKSAYHYDSKDGKVYKTCAYDVLGVTVDAAGFVGSYDDKEVDETYSLVAINGTVDVYCDANVQVGDYVYPGAEGRARKSDGHYGYLVVARDNVEGKATIVLAPSIVNAKTISDYVDYLLAETKRVSENVVKAVSDASTALNAVNESKGNLNDAMGGVNNTLGNMLEQLSTNTTIANRADMAAAEAKKIANQAQEYVDEIVITAGGDATTALSKANAALNEVTKLSEEMTPLVQYTDPKTGELLGVAGYIAKSDANGATLGEIVNWKNDDVEGYAATVKRVDAHQTSIDNLASFETDTKNTLAQINQTANEQGASITALTSKIDKYSVGEYSQAYGLTQAEAADILEAGKIVFIPTDFVSGDASFTEIYNPIVVETWTVDDKNQKYVYSDGSYYYYHDGSKWTSVSISDGQTAGYCVTRFAEGYSYVWNGLKWQPEYEALNVFFTDSVPTTVASVSPLYWVVGAKYEGKDYKVGGLYLYDAEKSSWKECALGSSNSMSRTTALVKQTQNEWQTAISNVEGDLATIKTKVDENGSNVAMVASVVKEVTGVNLDFADNSEKVPYVSKDNIISTDKTKYFVVGEKTPYDIYYYDGSQYVQKINWSYDGQRVLQPNAASIVASANEDTTGVKIDANHINFNSDTFTVQTDDFRINAKDIDFTGDNYKIKANNVVDIEGNVVFSNYAKLEDVITNTEYRYALSASNTELESNVEWSSTYPVRASNQYIWREIKITKGNNNVITTVECITPADGKDGTSVNIKGMADNCQSNGAGLYILTVNGATISNAELGDGYMYGTPADLYVCVAKNETVSEPDLFQNVGQIQGPQGISGASLEIKYLNASAMPTITDNNVSAWSNVIAQPNEGENTYMTQRVGTAGTWSTPVQISGIEGKAGADGESIKFIYYRSETEKTNWIGSFDGNGMFISGELAKDNWYESPQGVDNTNKYEYVSTSTTYDIVKLVVDGKDVEKKNWKGFTSPVLWSKYGEKGQDGDGVEYWYYLSNSKTPPIISDFNGNTGEFTKTSGNIVLWTNEPSNTTLDNPYEYVVQIKKITTNDATIYTKSDVALWAVYDGLLARYVVGVAQPTTPTGDGLTEAYAATETSGTVNWSKTPPATIDVGKVLWVSYKTVLGQDWGMPVKTSAIDGLNGAGIKKIETYYLVTDIEDPEVTANGIEEPTVEVNSFTYRDNGNTVKTVTPKWNTEIEHWGVKVDENHQRTTDEDDVVYRYQYLWVYEKTIMDDANNTIKWGTPRLDATNATIGNWCAENDKTLINGGNIATGTVTAKQIATDAIKSQNYSTGNGVFTLEEVDIGFIQDLDMSPERVESDINTVYYCQNQDSTYTYAKYYSGYDNGYGSSWRATFNAESLPVSDAGSFLNLADGSFDSPNLKWTEDGAITATAGTIAGWAIGEGSISKSNDATDMMVGMLANDTPYYSLKSDDVRSPVRFYAGEKFDDKLIDEGSVVVSFDAVENIGDTTSKEIVIPSAEHEVSLADGVYYHENIYTSEEASYSFSTFSDISQIVDTTSDLTIIKYYGSCIVTFSLPTWLPPDATPTIVVNSTSGAKPMSCIYLGGGRVSLSSTTIKSGVSYAGTVQLVFQYTENLNIKLSSPETNASGETVVIAELTPKTLNAYPDVTFNYKERKGDFVVLEDGSLYANNAKITGEIHATTGSFAGNLSATKGTIGDLIITNSGLRSAETTTGYELGVSGINFYNDDACLQFGNKLTMKVDSDSGHIQANGNLKIGSNEACLTFNSEKTQVSIEKAFHVFGNYTVKEGGFRQIEIWLEDEDQTLLLQDQTLNVEWSSYAINAINSAVQTKISGGSMLLTWKAEDIGETSKYTITFTEDHGTSNIRFTMNIYNEEYLLTWGELYTSENGMGSSRVQLSKTKGVFTQDGYDSGIKVKGSLIPSVSDKYNLGSDGLMWDNIWATNDTIQTSDRNKKNSIQPLSGSYEQIFDELKPVSYKFNQNNSNRTHTGLIAQDVKAAVELAGLTTQDFAGYCEWEQEDGTIGCGLRYGEFIALCVDQVQKLKQRVTEQDEKIKDLEARLLALENK